LSARDKWYYAVRRYQQTSKSALRLPAFRPGRCDGSDCLRPQSVMGNYRSWVPTSYLCWQPVQTPDTVKRANEPLRDLLLNLPHWPQYHEYSSPKLHHCDYNG